MHWGILRWGGQWLGPAGVKLPELTVPDAVWKVYPDLSHAEDWAAAIEATSFVPDDVIAELADAYGLIGTPEYCADRIAEMSGLGVRNISDAVPRWLGKAVHFVDIPWNTAHIGHGLLNTTFTRHVTCPRTKLPCMPSLAPRRGSYTVDAVTVVGAAG